MTLRELSIQLKGASWRREYEGRARLSLAWHTAIFERMKKMPKLEEVLGEKSETPERKGKLQRAAWIDWAIAHGFKITKHDSPVVF